MTNNSVFVPGGTPEEMISFMEEKLKDKDLCESVRAMLKKAINEMCPHTHTSTPVRHESGIRLTRCNKCGKTW